MFRSEVEIEVEMEIEIERPRRSRWMTYAKTSPVAVNRSLTLTGPAGGKGREERAWMERGDGETDGEEPVDWIDRNGEGGGTRDTDCGPGPITVDSNR